MAAVQRTYGSRTKDTVVETEAACPTTGVVLLNDALLRDEEDDEDLTPPTSQVSLVMTPKSKIAAMLAEIDASPAAAEPIVVTKAAEAAQDVELEDDSDEDIVLPGSRARAAVASRTVSSPIAESMDAATKSSDETMPRPAAKVNLTIEEIMAQSDEDEEDQDNVEAESAYDKLRKQLMKHQQAVPISKTAASDADSDSDIDLSAVAPETVPTQTPKLSKREKLIALARQKREAAAAAAAAKDGGAEEEQVIATSIKEKDQTSGSGTEGSESEEIEAQMRLSSARRPKRAASKKALEEMHKKTARMERGMGLVPEARVNKKLTVTDFFTKIGYGKKKDAVAPVAEKSAEASPEVLAVEPVVAAALPMAPVAPVASPAPVLQPPVTPAKPLPTSAAFAPGLEESDEEEEDIELPSLGELMVVKSRSPTPEPPAPVEEVPAPIPEAPSAVIESTVAVTADPPSQIELEDSSEDEAPLPAHLKGHGLLFAKRDFAKIEKDRKAAKFHALARPDSPTKIEARLEKQRQRELRARDQLQAKAVRAEREAAMKAAGLTITSAADRQKEAIEIEDLVERARRQAQELRALEKKEDAKRKAQEDGVNDEEEEDEDYMGDSPAASDASEVDDSGNDASESGSEDEAEDVVEPAQSATSNVVSPSKVYDSAILSERHLTDDDEEAPTMQSRPAVRKKRHQRVVDEADSEEDKENAEPSNAPASPNNWGLTQFFEPTQEPGERAVGPAAAAISATQFAVSPTQNAQADRTFAALREGIQFDAEESMRLRSPTRVLPDEPTETVPSSWPERDLAMPMATQFSVFGPLSDDDDALDLPLRGRQESTLTQPTQVDGSFTQATLQTIPEPPKKLSRMRKAVAGDMPTQTSPPKKPNAYRIMKEALNAEQTAKARKALLDDRAVESDDEYAGMGGASDDDAEETAAMAKELDAMIDHDAAELDAEGRAELAALYAAKDLEMDEKMVANLMNDINNGGLRKKRGAGLLDMDDSEDEEEEQARYKARQELMRTRLLESQNLTSLADNPKARAFLDAMEDRESRQKSTIDIAGEDDLFGSLVQETQPEATPLLSLHPDTVQTQADSQQTVADSFAVPLALPGKRPHRKTASDIRETLSFLKQDDDHGFSSDEENDGSRPNSARILDPDFVPMLKRERSSLSIEDRSKTGALSRGDSLCSVGSGSQGGPWRDPKLAGLSRAQSGESMYAKLSKARSTGGKDQAGTTGHQAVAVGTALTTVSQGVQKLSSRRAKGSVNYMNVQKQQQMLKADASGVTKRGRKGVPNEKHQKSVSSLFK